MHDKELAYAKQGIMSTKNWDSFQRLLRRALKVGRSGEGEGRGQCSSVLLRGAVCVGLFLALLGLGGFDSPAAALTRTQQQGPAIVIVAFGTTTEARQTYEVFESQLKQELPKAWQGAPVSWAYTSSIVRERANKKFAEQGSPQRYKSLSQVLADLQDQGYGRVAVQSLHIFTGQEYEEMEREIAAFRDLGLRIEYGGTLLHRWQMLFAVVRAISPQFLPPDQGCTLLVSHGTPETFSGANIAYLGLERHLRHSYPNVSLGTVDGIIPRQESLAQVKDCSPARVRIVPFMFVAGDHIMNDIMGEEADKDGTPSWAMELKAAGLAVETVRADYQGRSLFKGLGLYPEINRLFIEQLVASLERLGS